MKNSLILIFLFLFCICLFYLKPNLTLANEEGVQCPPPPNCPRGTISQTYYTCTQRCDGKIQIQTTYCYYDCWAEQIGTDQNGCPIYTCKCDTCSPPPPSPDNWQDDEKSFPWEKCSGPYHPNYSTSRPTFSCSGECLKVPKNPRYYDNPEYPKDPFNPEEGKPSQNIFLPVKFDWDDVEGWKGGWKKNGEIKNCERNCLKSYRIRFEETTKGEYSTVIDKSEYNYRQDPNAGPCFLKSGKTQIWHVKACCNADGTNCGPESNWQFTTNWAPEPIGIFYNSNVTSDPDWNGNSTSKNLPLNLTLKWCKSDFKYEGSEGPMAYKLIFCQKDISKKDVCHPLLKKNVNCSPSECPFYLLLAEPGSYFLSPLPEFSNEKYAFFTKNNSYAWQVAACKDSSANYCTDYGQKWRFETTGQIETPILAFPVNEEMVGLPVVFNWWGSLGSASYIYEVYDASNRRIHYGTTSVVGFSLDFPILSPNAKYYWRVKPCWDFQAKECEEVWAGSYFWVTGRAPKTESLVVKKLTDIFIPAEFEWENVPGAKSYIFTILGDGLNLKEILSEPKYSLDFPFLKQLKNYSWQVKTCAKEKSENCVKNESCCGNWSGTKTFMTSKLSFVQIPYPQNNSEIFIHQMPIQFSWELVSGAKYYQYELMYVEKSSEEKNENCNIGSVTSTIINNNSIKISLMCLGKYRWKIKACLDEFCKESGDWSSEWSFVLSQKIPVGGGGLVPCGRDYIDPIWAKRGWDTREKCQIKHLFVLLQQILDFLLWRIGPVILVLLTLGSALLNYLSLGSTGTLIQIKEMWKSAGKGYGIIFLAWIIVNLFLAILGYKFEIFGRWYQIKF